MSRDFLAASHVSRPSARFPSNTPGGLAWAGVPTTIPGVPINRPLFPERLQDRVILAKDRTQPVEIMRLRGAAFEGKFLTRTTTAVIDEWNTHLALSAGICWAVMAFSDPGTRTPASPWPGSIGEIALTGTNPPAASHWSGRVAISCRKPTSGIHSRIGRTRPRDPIGKQSGDTAPFRFL